MPKILTRRGWQSSIVIAQGAILQNLGSQPILVCAVDPPSADDSLLIAPGEWYVCTAAMPIRAVSQGRGVGVLSIAAGLGLDDGSDVPSPPQAGRAEIQGTSLPTGSLTAVIESQGTPAAAVESIQWTLDGADIPGATGLSLDKTGLPVDAVVSFRFVLANGILPKFEGVASNPVRISPLPQITGVVSPNPIRPGEAFTLNFDPIPDTATMMTVPGGVTTALSGTGQQRSGTAPQSGSIEIDAAKVDHAPFEATYEVVPYPAALSREDNLAVITGATEPTSITISLPDDPASPLNGTHTGPAASQTGAPVWIAGPWLTVDGPDLVLDPGTLYIQDARIASVDWAWPDLTTGLRWPHRPEDAGTTFPLTLNAVDDLGRETSVTVSVAIPASTLAGGITPLGLFSGTNTASATSKDIVVDIGPADPQKTLIVAVIWGPEPAGGASPDQTSLKIIKDGVEYLGTERNAQSIDVSNRRIELWTIPCSVGGAATLRIGGQATEYPGHAHILAGKNVAFVSATGTRGVLTAGTQTTFTPATSAGDHVLFFAIADVINAAGLFDTMINGSSEIYDQAIATEPQLLVLSKTAGTGTSTQIGAVPNASGNQAKIAAVFRSNP